jgi:hypothetical protein
MLGSHLSLREASSSIEQMIAEIQSQSAQDSYNNSNNNDDASAHTNSQSQAWLSEEELAVDAGATDLLSSSSSNNDTGTKGITRSGSINKGTTTTNERSSTVGPNNNVFAPVMEMQGRVAAKLADESAGLLRRATTAINNANKAAT